MRSRKRIRKHKRGGYTQPQRPDSPPPIWKTGDSVVVKPGVRDPDFDIDIRGWQGRVLEEANADGLILIGWDSITLRQMPDAIIAKSEEEGLNWSQMFLKTTEVEAAGPRDSPEDVRQAIWDTEDKHAWSFLGEEGLCINRILAGVDRDDDVAAVRAWKRYLDKHLTFPFEAKIVEFQERGPLQAGDRLRVLGISEANDFYGIIVSVRSRRGQLDFPLCDLEVIDEDSPNYEPVHDYCVWFANR